MWRYLFTAVLWSFLLCVYCLSVFLNAHHSLNQLPLSARTVRSERHALSKQPSHPTAVANVNTTPSICSALTPLPEGEEWQRLERSLETYKHFHSAHVSCTHCRVLVWTCGMRCSGLGDQLQQVAMALLLAIVSERVLFLHWDERYTMMRHLRPGQINWSVVPQDALQAQSTDASLVEAILSSTAHVTTLSRKIDVPFWRSYTEFGKIELLRKGFEKIGLNGILKTERDRNQLPYVMGLLLRFLFNFSSEIFSQLEQTQSSLSLISGRYVAVHLRTGFLGSAEEEKGRLSSLKVSRSKQLWEVTLNCSLQLADAVYGTKSPVLLATDSEIVRQWAVGVYGERVRTATHPLTHSAYTHSTDDSGGWMDFLLLARAGHMIRGVSGFAVIAGAMCSLPQTRQCSLNCKCRQHYSYHSQTQTV